MTEIKQVNAKLHCRLESWGSKARADIRQRAKYIIELQLPPKPHHKDSLTGNNLTSAVMVLQSERALLATRLEAYKVGMAITICKYSVGVQGKLGRKGGTRTTKSLCSCRRHVCMPLCRFTTDCMHNYNTWTRPHRLGNVHTKLTGNVTFSVSLSLSLHAYILVTSMIYTGGGGTWDFPPLSSSFSLKLC